jgi:hypothetical protein
MCIAMLSYFDDHLLSVIDIYKQLFHSYLDFALSVIKRLNHKYYIFFDDLTAIKLLRKKVYKKGNIYDEKQESKCILDDLDK